MGWNLHITRKLLIVAALGLHASATMVVHLIGKTGLASPLFPDSLMYQTQIVALSNVLTDSGVAPWLFALLPLHVKLYTLCFVLFDRWADFSIILIEPLNALYYLAILYLVFKLSSQVFDPQTSLLAAIIVGLWPSFLAHTTQPLRDPLFIAVALLFLLITLRWLTKEYSLRNALAVVALGAVTESVLWVTRSDMWELMIAVAFITCVMLIVRMSKERRIVWGNLVGAVMLLVISVLIPRVAVQFYIPAYYWAASYGVASFETDDAAAEDNSSSMPSVAETPRQIKGYLPARIFKLRERFIISYPDAGSNIDTDVRFSSTADIIGYLPRAMLIGLFAPFPRMWFADGSQNGRLGRLIGGLESLALYVIELMAVVALWRNRRKLSAWWLGMVSIMGTTALGLVVTNVGALYRIRYLFVILLVILGSEGIRQTLRLISSTAGSSEGQMAANTAD